jgi:hypothetical protein
MSSSAEGYGQYLDNVRDIGKRLSYRWRPTNSCNGRARLGLICLFRLQ